MQRPSSDGRTWIAQPGREADEEFGQRAWTSVFLGRSAKRIQSTAGCRIAKVTRLTDFPTLLSPTMRIRTGIRSVIDASEDGAANATELRGSSLDAPL